MNQLSGEWTSTASAEPSAQTSLPIEAPLSHRPAVVAALLELRADPTRRGRYVPWWGGASSPDVLAFAIANGCDAATLELLSAARQQRVV